jgi:dTDP-4-dehydrorhamnose 3,5-epimerase
MKITETGIANCYLVEKPVFDDPHSSLHTVYKDSILLQSGIRFDIHEVLLSTSGKNVLRGMHFQLFPKGTAKVVACLFGEIFDAVLDLRKDSPTYLKTFTTLLSEDDNSMIYIPEGVAHGFYSFRDNSTILYMTSGIFSPEHDSGILWNSAGIDWPEESPIISDRDQQLAPLEAFASPF